MLRIYDEHQLLMRLRLKRLQVVLLLAAGCIIGLWLAQSGEGLAIASPATIRLTDSPALTPRWCDDTGHQGPRFDCTLSLRESVAARR
ncbi:MAG: hypothetical protein AABY95_07225 [Pseudomonadota bacterium]